MLVFSLCCAAPDWLLQIHRGAFVQTLSAVIVALCIVLSGFSATAAETVFNNRAEFEASLGPFRVISFEPDQGFSGGLIPSFDGGQIQTRSELGAYFGPASIIRHSSSANQLLVGADEIGGHPNSNVRLLFAVPQFAIGFDAIGAGDTVVVNVAYLDSSTSQHIFDAGDINPSPFFGLRSDVGFRDVFIMGANRGDPNNPGEQPNHIDNLTLIPEPGSAALFIVGAFALVLRRHRAVRRILAAVLIACCPALALADAPYQFISLGTDFYPYRISESGQVVGRGAERGFGPALVWEKGVFRNVGVGEGQDINDAGQILLSVPLAGDGRPTPRIWQNGAAAPLPIPPWHSDFRHFYDMNASGHVVGQAVNRAFLWANNQLTYLDSTIGSSAYAINDAGQVIGRSSTGFLWDQGNVTLLPDTPMDINNRGQVLLMSSVWEGGTVTPIPLLPLLPGSIPEATEFRAEAINDRGQVVARQTEKYLIDPESGLGAKYRNLLWDPVLGSQDLTSLVGDDPQEWGFAAVNDINSAGQIVGIRENEAFLLTPVPEPASVFLVILAGCVLLLIGLRAYGGRARRNVLLLLRRTTG